MVLNISNYYSNRQQLSTYLVVTLHVGQTDFLKWGTAHEEGRGVTKILCRYGMHLQTRYRLSSWLIVPLAFIYYDQRSANANIKVQAKHRLKIRNDIKNS